MITTVSGRIAPKQNVKNKSQISMGNAHTFAVKTAKVLSEAEKSIESARDLFVQGGGAAFKKQSNLVEKEVFYKGKEIIEVRLYKDGKEIKEPKTKKGGKSVDLVG